MSLRDIIIPSEYKNVCNDLFTLPRKEGFLTSPARARRTDYLNAIGVGANPYYNSYTLLLGNDFYNNVNCLERVKCGVKETHYIHPSFQIDAFGLRELDQSDFDITESVATFIVFKDLVFPQTLASNSDQLEKEFNEYNSLFHPTGHSFSGAFDVKTRRFLQNNEYEFNGELYVRVKARKAEDRDFNLRLNGEFVKCVSGRFYWFKVEPIKFNIENWDKAPSFINKNGTGEDNVLKLHSTAPIFGAPYYLSEAENCAEWQNSIPRAYLNGYNLHKEIESGNGDVSLKMGMNFDFEGHGFLDEAIKIKKEANKEKEVKLRPNPYGVSINNTPLSVKEQMRFYIDEGISFMLHGPSGVGKTRRVQELDPDCVCLQLRNGILPEEITGKTGTEGRQSFWIEPTWYTRIKEVCQKDPEHNHVLFIDELTNVRPNEQSLVFHLVLSRSIDGNIGKLPDNCVVVAAGNSPEESEAAYNMPEPLFRRFEAHIELKPDIKDFLEWGSEKRPDGKTKIHPLVAAFVAANDKNAFYTKYDSEKPPKFAIDPRGWEQVSNIIYANKGELRIKMLADKIGESNAIALIKFASLPRITIEDILSDQVDLKALPSKQTEKYALTCSFKCVDEKGVKKVREFVKVHLGRENLEVFDSLWVENDDERAILLNQIDEEEKALKTKIAQQEQKKKPEKDDKKRDKHTKSLEDEVWDRFTKSAVFKNIMDL